MHRPLQIWIVPRTRDRTRAAFADPYGHIRPPCRTDKYGTGFVRGFSIAHVGWASGGQVSPAPAPPEPLLLHGIIMKKRVWVKVKERWECRYHPPRQRRRRKPGRRREGEVGEACEASAALDEQAREAPWVKCISDSRWVCKGCVDRFARGSNPVLRRLC